MQDITNIIALKFPHDIMESYFKGNVPVIKHYYIGYLRSKPKDDFPPKTNVVEGQMVIAHSPNQDYAIWLGMEKGSVHQDPDPSMESHIVEVQWWKPT